MSNSTELEKLMDEFSKVEKKALRNEKNNEEDHKSSSLQGEPPIKLKDLKWNHPKHTRWLIAGCIVLAFMFSIRGLIGSTYHQVSSAMMSVQKKVVDIHLAHEQNRFYKLENANLRQWVEVLQFKFDALKSTHHTNELNSGFLLGSKLNVGRALASLDYQPPLQLLPPQLYILAMSYFRAGEFEKATAIFTYLTQMKENHAYQTPQNYLLTGVAWYQLNKMDLAMTHINLAMDSSKLDPDEYKHIEAQGRLWKALVYHKIKDNMQSQTWLKELVDYHPKSAEAGWINPIFKKPFEKINKEEKHRKVASEEKHSPHVKKHSGEKHKNIKKGHHESGHH
mgnify:CR=1 FL=1